MKRVLILGCCGAGKTTFAQKLGELRNLPQISLDQYYFSENWTESPKNEWESIIKELVKKEKWIMDGNYSGTLPIRFQRATDVIYLDYSTISCLGRVLKRTFKHYGKVRPHMASGCRERFSFEFIHYVATFNYVKRDRLLSMLESLPQHINVTILRNDKEVLSFINNQNS